MSDLLLLPFPHLFLLLLRYPILLPLLLLLSRVGAPSLQLLLNGNLQLPVRPNTMDCRQPDLHRCVSGCTVGAGVRWCVVCWKICTVSMQASNKQETTSTAAEVVCVWGGGGLGKGGKLMAGDGRDEGQT